MHNTINMFLEVLHLAEDQLFVRYECFHDFFVCVYNFYLDFLRTIRISDFLLGNLSLMLVMGNSLLLETNSLALDLTCFHGLCYH